MAPSVAELIAALPAEPEEPTVAGGPDAEVLDRFALRPVPLGQFRRMRLLGTLQAKIAAAYLFHWIRGWFKNADEKQRLLAETHWRTGRRTAATVAMRGNPSPQVSS